MVLKPYLLAAACAAALLSPATLAHQPPAPLRALEGGSVKEAGGVRVELVSSAGALILSFRDRQNAPIAARLESLQRWDDTGLHPLTFETHGHRVVVASDADHPPFRTFARIRGTDGTGHLLVFAPLTDNGVSP